MIHGGTRFNIIPGEVALEGTVRTYDPAVQDTVERRMREILDGVTRAGGGSFELDYDRIVPVTINDLALTERSVPSLVAAIWVNASWTLSDSGRKAREYQLTKAGRAHFGTRVATYMGCTKAAIRGRQNGNSGSREC